MWSISSSTFPPSLRPVSTVLLLFIGVLQSHAQSKYCKEPKILSALRQNTENGSDSFCAEFIASNSYIGTLRQDPTFFFYETSIDQKSTELVYKYVSTTITKAVTTTSYASQKRQGANFTMPFPSYVQQYPSARVSAGCSCLIGSGPTYSIYRNCEQATTTRRVSTTFTITYGRPGTITTTYTETSTVTKLKSTSAPYPSLCPDANHVDYIATDKSQWDRLCGSGFTRYRFLDTVKAPNLNECIERCVDYNQKMGYKQCQGVSYNPRKNDCDRLNYVGYAPPDAGGFINVASMRFLPPVPTQDPDYCATVSGAAR